MRYSLQHVCVLVVVVLASNAAFAAPPTAAQLRFFETKIRPVLSSKCYKCHSTKAKKLKGKLFLDSHAATLKGGETGPAVVPGDLDKSLLIEAVRYKNVDLEMPPKKKLSDAEIADFETWVKMGAPWPKEKAPVTPAGKIEKFDFAKRMQEHWAWKPVTKPAAPSVKNGTWAKAPLDKFILAALEAKGLKPSPETDRRTWLRRVTFDLIGLPPTPKEITAFEADKTPTAYAKVVDRLLASPHFGERWGRHWMDLVRYAESFGHEFDYTIPNAYRYRDYLINAFNQDVPYNQLITEHVAGDLIEKPRRHPETKTNESIVGTTFWFIHEATHAPTDVLLDEADRIDNQITTLSHTFLGVSVGCARCHDHKFDPIPTSDYYAMAGFLQSSRRQQAMLDPGGKIREVANQLRALKAKGDQAMRPAAGKGGLSDTAFASYLQAAHDAIHGKVTAGKAPAAPKPSAAKADVVFEDFEGGKYNGWRATGNAFGKAPSRGANRGQQKVSGFVGKGLVNSYPGTDRAKGTLTSKSFKIEHRYIHMLVGGGPHKGATAVNLIVDGKTVQTMNGHQNEQLIPRSWDVNALKGKTATIQIVDNHQGGWGHINVDHIVFSNKKGSAAAVAAKSAGPQVSDAVIAAAAKKYKVDATQLKAWIGALSSSEVRDDPGHPLHAWSVLATQANTGAFTKAKLDLRRKLQPAPAPAKVGEATPLGNFDNGKMDGWFVTGEAFKRTPTGVEWDPSSGGLADPGTIHGGLFGRKLHGVVRSPTFTVTPKKVHIRIKATGVQVRLIIEGYQMQPNNGLLFGGTNIKKLDTKGKFQWIEMTSGLHYGRRAYVEIIDHGDGYAIVDEAWANGRGTTGSGAGASTDLLKLITGSSFGRQSTLAKGFGQLWASTVDRWGKDKTNATDRKLIAWALKHKLIAAGGGDGLEAIRKQMQTLERSVPRPQLVYAMTEGTPENNAIYIRGGHKRPGPEAPRRLIQALGGQKQAPIVAGSGRMELAKRMIDPANPLTRRVVVNRVWHHLFGRGIVSSVDDFGKMGMAPSHPKLLDHLATQFDADGWSMKKTIRKMVLSSTYRMSSKPWADQSVVAKVDPTNALLHRMPIRRLQAEAIRDQIIAVSGRLDRKIGGPSVAVFLTPFQQGRGKPRGGPIDGAGRRSVYLATRRNFLSSMMLAYDFPVPFTTMGRRTTSNVPAQALAMLNDPFVVAEAKRWGAAVAGAGGSAKDKITAMFETAFAQKPTAKQLAKIEAFLGNRNDAAAWGDVAHTIFNMKQFIYLN